ncbi:Zn-dependent hydrolase, partial [Klebsiella quasipneumoniae]|nr:Zn-dependent hydrolase [Klebsiella quasipneumoniae]
EEGSRFGPVMMGSGVFAGVFPLEEPWAVTDKEGVSVGEALAQIGYSGEQTPGEHPVGAYFEAHISHGQFLEDEAKTIGFLHGVLGI